MSFFYILPNIDMNNNLIILKEYRDKVYVYEVLCTKSSEYYSGIKSVNHIPLLCVYIYIYIYMPIYMYIYVCVWYIYIYVYIYLLRLPCHIISFMLMWLFYLPWYVSLGVSTMLWMTCSQTYKRACRNKFST
jgi:hypothetical protein